MRTRLILAGSLLAATPAAAPAQSSMIPDLIAQTIMAGRSSQIWSDKCFDGRWQASAEHLAKGPERVEAVMANYRALAAAGTDLRGAIGSEGARDWRLDGVSHPVKDVHDPFLARTARLERLFIRSSNGNRYYRVQWRALAADGSEVGIYDGLLWGLSPKFMTLSLYTPGSKERPPENVPFCQFPKDVAQWQQARADRDAQKAQRAAEAAARRAR